jgi:hypothetical protein
MSWAGNVGILFCLMGLLLGCKSRSFKGSSASASLLGVVRQMPDSLRENPFGEKQGLRMTDAEMDQLIAQGALEVSEGETWRLQWMDSARTHLKLAREGAEEGLQYELLRLPGSKTKAWVLVLQRLDDHCCSYGRWALYQQKKGVLIDQTEARMPRLDWSDFFSAADLADLQPTSPRYNRYPFAMELMAQPAQIHIDVVADYLELNFPEAQAASLIAHLPAKPRTLIWRDMHFAWAQD